MKELEGNLMESGRVHIIDDDGSVRSALSRLLRSRGYETAEFGASFWPPARESTAASRWTNPAGPDGPACSRSCWRDAPSIISSPHAADAVAGRRHAPWRGGFLMKPVDEDDWSARSPSP
jgi:hypothetical protein